MKKKIFIAIGTLVIVFIGFIAYTMLTTRNHSPADTIKYSENGVGMSITYCRPFKKDRTIFGTEKDEALIPYDVYWRTGANEATEITFEQNVIINGKTLEAGTYRFYTIPNKKEWTIAFNSELGQWGYYEPNYELDVMRTNVMSEKLQNPVEQFTISYEPQGTHVNIVLSWDQTQIKIPVSANS